MKTKKDIPEPPKMTEEEKQKGIEIFVAGAKDNQMNVSIDGNVSGNKSGNINRNIVINKPIKPEGLKRVSYYLKPSTIKKIEDLAALTDMKISPWFQKFLEENLDKVEIK